MSNFTFPILITTIAGTIILVTIGVVVFFFLRQRRDMAQAYQHSRDVHAAQKRAVWAGATVIDARSQKIGLYGADHVRVELRLEVNAPDGSTYTAKTVWTADPMMLSQLQPGASISVKIDSDDPNVVYPNMGGVEYWAGGSKSS